MIFRPAAKACLLSLSLTVVVLGFRSSPAAETPSPPVSLRYRRVFVPADDLESQVKGMIPLKREEFERRIADSTVNQPSQLASHVRVQEALYSARLEGMQLVEGTAQLAVVNATGVPAPLPLESTLAFGKPQWDEQPLRHARLGTTPDDVTVLLVEKSGKLILPWSLRGSKTAGQDASFDLVLPKATVSRLVLQLPADCAIESDTGIVSRLKPDSFESQLVPVSDSEKSNWLIELGGLYKSRLRVRSLAQKSQDSGILLVRESATHILSPIDVSSEFTLQIDAHQTELNCLKLELDAPSRIIGVRISGAALPWRELPASNRQQTVLQVDLPEPLAGSGSILTVSTVTPLTANRPWRLPRTRLLDSTWQEGTATMVVSSVLQVGSIQLVDARQTSMSAGTSSQPEQAYQFQYLSTVGQIVVQCAREVPRLNVLGGLVLRHEATQLSATLSLDLSVDSGERFLVEGITSEEWIIDSVDTTPSDLLEERQFVPVEGRRFALRLRLARPITSREKVRLILRAHRQLPAEGEGISAPALRLVEFQNTREEQYVVALRVADNSREFQLSGDLDLFRIDPESAAPEELSLLDSSSAGILFRLDRQAEGAKVSLVPSDPQFAAAIESFALAYKGKVEHRVIARIIPASASLVRLYVRASGPIAAGMRWHLVGARDLMIASQTLLPTQLPRVPDGQQESVWELVLSRPTNQPITLQAAWETAPSPEESLPLFSFPEAASQSGMARIETGQGVLLRMETAGVKSVPAPLAPSGTYPSIRGIFRYEPGRQATIRLLAASSEDMLPLAWVNNCLLTSRFAPDGAATHEITWNLENCGLDRFPFSLPTGVRISQVLLDGEDMPLPSLDAKTQLHLVPLPVGRRSPVLSLVVSSMAPKTQSVLSKHFTAPLITTPLKILDRNWKATLPPGIRPISNEAIGDVSNLQRWSEIWNTRVRGLLAPSIDPNQAEQLEFPWLESEPLVIVAYSPGMVRMGGIALAIAVASLGVWMAYRRIVFMLLLAAFFASAALLLSPLWSPLAAGVFWGCVAGCLFSLVRPFAVSHHAVPRSSPSTRTIIATGFTGSLLFIAMAATELPRAVAAPEAPQGIAVISKSHRVIIPVDSDLKPQGDYVYVSLDFYTLLFRSPAREHLPAWLRRATNYELEAVENGAAANIVMRLELETLAAHAQVSLPFRRGEIHLLEGRAALDGDPVSLDWNDAGTALRFEVERPGVYQLTLAFTVPAKSENGNESWRFNIPSAPRSTLQIKAPLRPEDWNLPADRGAITKSPTSADLVAELGAAGIVDVSRNDPRRPTKDMTEAEQFVWWHLRPGSVTADVLFRLRPVSGSIREIKLLTDPHLRLLPLEDEPRVTRVWAEEGDPSTLHLTLSEPTAELVQIRCKFLLLDASGIGRFVLPQLEVVADRTSKQWGAISGSQERAISPDPKIPIISHPPVEFVDNIGGAPRPPNLAFEATGSTPAFLVRPHEGVVHAREFVDISLGHDDAEFIYRADLSGIPLHRFQEMIDLPVGFRVKKAVLLEQGICVSLPSQEMRQGSLTIHRTRPPGPTQQLEIEGTLTQRTPATQTSTIQLPQIRLAETDGATIRIYRTPATLSVIRPTLGIEPSTVPAGAPWDPRLGYLLASLKSAPSSQPIARGFVVETRPNNPAANVRLITRMERTAARSWSAVVNCEVSPERGSLDTVRFEVPAEWSGPFEFTPPMDYQVVLLPGQTQRHLIIRPYKSPSDILSFSIRGPVKSQTGDAPHAPVVLPLDTVRADSFLVLPTRIADEDLQWQTSGLLAMAAGEPEDAKLQTGQEIFRVVAPRFAANLLQLKNSRARASIALADLLVRPTSTGSYWTRANYYLVPGGRDEARLQLPAGGELVQVLVNDSPADLRTQSGGSLRVRLGHDQLPQLVTVIYQLHPLKRANQMFEAHPPLWQGMSVGKTNWTFLPNQDRRLARFSHTTDEVQGEDSRELSLEKMAAIIRVMRDAGDASVSGLPPQQLGDWLSRWRLEFAQAEQSAGPLSSFENTRGSPSIGDELETKRRSLEAEFAAVLTRYPDISIGSFPPQLDGSSEMVAKDREHLQVFQTQDSASLSLVLLNSRSNFRNQLALAVSFLLLSLTTTLFVSMARFREIFASSPAFMLAIVSVVCLLLLPLPLISALLPAAAAVWYSLWRNWFCTQLDSPSQLFPLNPLSRYP